MDREVEKSSQMRWVELDSEVWKGFKNLKGLIQVFLLL